MKISYAVELIVVVALGLAMARWHVQDPKYSGVRAQMTWAPWLKQAGEGFFAGAAVGGVIGLLIEVASRRSPQIWGLGRWAWSVVGLFLISRHAFTTVNSSIRYYRFKEPLSKFIEDFPSDLRANFGFWLLNFAPYVLIAIGLTLLVAGPKATRADAREWSGRIFAGMIIFSGIAANLFSAAGY